MAFYRWLTKDYRMLFPQLPERTRLFRLFKTHQDWTQLFLAAPTVLGVIDTYGLELIHPMREGRRPSRLAVKASQSPLDCGWEAVSLIESVGIGRGMGVCHPYGQNIQTHCSSTGYASTMMHASP